MKKNTICRTKRLFFRILDVRISIKYPGEEYPDWMKEAIEKKRQLLLEKENY